VTKAQIIAANPGLDPNKLYVGKKIFIPDPNAK
jgi:LysM repeat protein